MCCTARRNAVLMECGHGGLCFECGQALVSRAPRLCPICRAPITQVLKMERRQRGSSVVVSREVDVGPEGILQLFPPAGSDA